MWPNVFLDWICGLNLVSFSILNTGSGILSFESEMDLQYQHPYTTQIKAHLTLLCVGLIGQKLVNYKFSTVWWIIILWWYVRIDILSLPMKLYGYIISAYKIGVWIMYQHFICLLGCEIPGRSLYADTKNTFEALTLVFTGSISVIYCLPLITTLT